MNDSHTFTSIASRLAHVGASVFERGWLSSNNILFSGNDSTALVDSGYCTHSSQTLALVQQTLMDRPLDRLLNTHLHSDHCGGNAVLQSAYPNLETFIPPGQADAVTHWDPVALTHQPTGQSCPAFHFQGLLTPGGTILLGKVFWEIHASKGHDPHSIVLFEPESRLLISADALWQHGFGVVFPELEGIDAFDEVAQTLTLIEALKPSAVIPGHGAVFEDVDSALQRARSRLDQFVRSPEKHRRYALKVLLKFKLLEWQAVTVEELFAWYVNNPYITRIEQRPTMPDAGTLRDSMQSLLNELAKGNALRIEGQRILDV